jgi:PKD repeat protein
MSSIQSSTLRNTFLFTTALLCASSGCESVDNPAPRYEVHRSALAPIADAATFGTDEDVTLFGTLSGEDGDGDVLRFRVTAEALFGLVELDAESGSFSYHPEQDRHGADSFRFVVNDGAQDSAEAIVDVTVRPVNDAPSVDGVQDRDGAEGESLSFGVTINDVDGDDLNITYVLPEGAAIDGEIVQWTPSFEQAGDHLYAVLADDGRGGVTFELASIRVANVNRAPVIEEVVIPGTGTEGEALGFSATADDPDREDVVRYRWDFGDGAEAVGREPTHRYADDGEFTVVLTVTDGMDDVVITEPVAVSNAAPVVEPLTDRTVSEGGDVSFVARATDAGVGDELAFAWRFGDAAVGQGREVAHRYVAQGMYVVELTVTDGDGGETIATCIVTVVNGAPSLDFGPDVEDVEGAEVTFTATASDPGVDPLVWTWNFGDGASVSGDALSQVTHVYRDDGEYLVRVQVDDGDGGVSSALGAARIANVAPSVFLTDLALSEGVASSLAADVADPGADDRFLYSWDFGDGQSATTLEPSVEHTWSSRGEYVVTLTVSDGADSGVGTATVTVANVAPTLQVPPALAADEGEEITLRGDADDPGMAPLVWTWTFGDGTEPLVGTGLSVVSHTFADDGVYAVSVRVSDGVDQALGAIQVSVANRAPLLGPWDDVEGDEGEELTLSVSAFDVEADILTYTWDLGDGAQISGEGLVEVAHRYADDGTFSVVVTVEDDDGGQTQDRRLATIHNVAPSLEEPITDRTTSEGSPLMFTVAPVDPGDDVVVLCWQFGDGDDETCGVDLVSIEHEWRDDGVYPVLLTVADEDGGRTEYAASVTVTNVTPEVSLRVPEVLQEGAVAQFEVDVVDPGDDEFIYAWNFEPGEGDEQVGPALAAVSHRYLADGVYSVSVQVTDDEGASAGTSVSVMVLNVPPLFLTRPILYVQPGEPYRYEAVAVDVVDPVIFALGERPFGMTVNESGVVAWTAPDAPGVARVELVAADDDESTAQSWEIQVGFEDADSDGAPDACELEYGFDPDDPEDGARDADGDGLSNAEECLRDSDPRLREGPQPPSVHAPNRGAIVGTLPVELSVNGSPGVEVGQIEFQLYGDPELRTLVREETLMASRPYTNWPVEEGFQEDHSYFWRARTLAEDGVSAWMRTSSFVFSVANDPPPMPRLIGPRGSVEGRPIFRLVSPVDPELELVQVELEVLNRNDAVIASTTWDTRGEEELEFVLPDDVEIIEDLPYTWRARGVDVRREAGAWAGPIAFRRNDEHAAPPAPALLSPAQGAVVEDLSEILFVVAAVTDPDGDEVVYDFSLATGEDLSDVLATASGVPADRGGELVLWPVRLPTPLTEDTSYWWSVQARDNASASPVSVGRFLASAQEAAPPQVRLLSPDDAAVVTSLNEPLVWLLVDDPEERTVRYQVEVFRDAGLSILDQRVQVDPGPMPGVDYGWTGGVFAENEEFWWRVRAVDEVDRSGVWSEARSFRVDARAQPPLAPTLLRPVDIVVDGPSVDLFWSTVSDPDGSPVSYRVEVYGAGSKLWAEAEVGGGVGDEVIWTAPELGPGIYAWRVLASDGELVSAWSDSAPFSIASTAPTADEIPDAPRARAGSDLAGCGVYNGRSEVFAPWFLRR